MTDDLNHAGHGVGAVEGAFGGVNDLDFIDVIESKVRKNEVATRKVNGGAVNEDLGEAGIAAVDEDGGKATDGAGTGKGDAGLRGEQIREGDGLALVDFLAADEIDGSGSMVDLEGLDVGGDDDIL